jgi:tetratricopeptide (TPR) repeat protein
MTEMMHQSASYAAQYWFDYGRLLASKTDRMPNPEERATLLEETIDHLRKALNLRTEAVAGTAIWGRIENNLGVALSTLGQMRSDPDLIEEAAGAFRASLQLKRVEDEPGTWAISKVNLARVLRNLGVRKQDKAKLQAAVAEAEEATASLQGVDAGYKDAKIIQRQLGRAEEVRRGAADELAELSN